MTTLTIRQTSMNSNWHAWIINFMTEIYSMLRKITIHLYKLSHFKEIKPNSQLLNCGLHIMAFSQNTQNIDVPKILGIHRYSQNIDGRAVTL